MTATFANFIVGLRAERERQAIENQLAESATLVTTLTNALPAAILFEDTKRNLQFVNPAFLEIFGAQGNPDDFIGMNCELVAEYSRPLFADPEGFFRRVHELLEAQETAAGDIVRLTNGKVYERDFVVVRQRSTVLGYLWKYREITAWHNEHQALSRVLDSALDAVIVMDSNGIVSFWNAKAESLFGYAPEEAVGQILSDLIVPEHLREHHQSGLARFLRTRQSAILDQVIQVDGLRKDASTIFVDLRITCIEDGPSPEFSAFIRPAH
jgi:PAS domain S-box-containing protein